MDSGEAEHAQLATLLNGGTHAVRTIKRAQILLSTGAGVSDVVIGNSVAVGESTVYRIRRRFVSGNLDLAMSEATRLGARKGERAGMPSQSRTFSRTPAQWASPGDRPAEMNAP